MKNDNNKRKLEHIDIAVSDGQAEGNMSLCTKPVLWVFLPVGVCYVRAEVFK